MKRAKFHRVTIADRKTMSARLFRRIAESVDKVSNGKIRVYGDESGEHGVFIDKVESEFAFLDTRKQSKCFKKAEIEFYEVFIHGVIEGFNNLRTFDI
jgi:hypothetical protein